MDFGNSLFQNSTKNDNFVHFPDSCEAIISAGNRQIRLSPPVRVHGQELPVVAGRREAGLGEGSDLWLWIVLFKFLNLSLSLFVRNVKKLCYIANC